ncbi:hypothetical protein EON63_21465 [archaeon]|nr:MAG: hypothetical protein EON63_21465 [archaeon]
MTVLGWRVARRKTPKAAIPTRIHIHIPLTLRTHIHKHIPIQAHHHPQTNANAPTIPSLNMHDKNGIDVAAPPLT